MGSITSVCCPEAKPLPTGKSALPLTEQNKSETSSPLLKPISPAAISNSGAPKPKKMSVKDFKNIAELGQGGYGKVHLVEKIATKERMALKVIPKSLLYNEKDRKVSIEEIFSEKNIMIQSDNPFLVKLLGAFQDETNLYFLMELLHGGNLFSYLHELPKHRLSEEATKFYAAEVVMALEYLHEKMHIIYRDLKPENILLTQDGHIKLADFGLAKRAEKMKGEVKGTPDFIAPEIYDNLEYDHRVDYWSLGCVIFEMLFGKPTFHHEKGEKKSAKIMSGKFTFPSEVNVSEDAKSLIRRLLDINQNTRLGANGIQEIKKHPFFASVDWEKMYKKQIAPPIGKLQLKVGAPSTIVDVNGTKGEKVEGFTYMPDTPEPKF